MKPKEYPLKVSQDIQHLLDKVRSLQLDNSDIVTIVESNENIISLRDIGSDFFIGIANPSQDGVKKGQTNFAIKYKPKNDISNDSHNLVLSLEDTINRMSEWIMRIRRFNSINFTEEDYISKAYEDEFYAEFEIVDEDASTKPFSSDQQVVLNKFLNSLTENLEKVNEKHPVEDILDEIKTIKKELPISTKKKVVKSLAKLLAKIKKLGTEAFNDVVKDKMKDWMKVAIAEGIRHLLS